MTYYEMFELASRKIGKSPSAAAVEIGMSKAAVTSWRRGGEPTSFNKSKINNFFGYDIENDVEIEKEPIDTEGGEDRLSKVERELMEYYRAVPIDVQAMLLKIAKDYANSL